jgi:hypothetical protein
LRIELLQLATLLLKYLPNDLVHHRNTLFYFANHLKEDDSSSKQWAYVNVCHFIAAYERPKEFLLEVEKIIYKISFRSSDKLAEFISVMEVCFYFSWSKDCKLAPLAHRSMPLSSSLLEKTPIAVKNVIDKLWLIKRTFKISYDQIPLQLNIYKCN